MSNSVYKANFIQMSPDNVRVIDANALVAKKLEGYMAKENQASVDDVPIKISEDGFNSIDISDLVTDVITSEDLVSEEVDNSQDDERASDIIREANEQAEMIIGDANSQADSIRENAYNEGKEQGYADGIEAANRELEAARLELEEERKQMLASFDERASEIEPKLVDAITRIYEKVFSDNFYNHKDVVVYLIHKALMNSETENGGAVLVSEEDIDFVEEARDKVFARLSNADEWEIKVSPKLSKGEAKIETRHGLIDCGIDTQLKELSRTLHVLSYED